MNRSPTAWLALGWIGFALLPWHLVSGDWFDIFLGFTAEGPRSAAGLAVTGRAWWLAPIVIALLLATRPIVAPPRKELAARWLIAAGVLGLALIAAQGFAIGIQGWGWAFLGAIFGEPGPTQAGMGFGAALTAASFLM